MIWVTVVKSDIRSMGVLYDPNSKQTSPGNHSFRSQYHAIDEIALTWKFLNPKCILLILIGFRYFVIFLVISESAFGYSKKYTLINSVINFS